MQLCERTDQIPKIYQPYIGGIWSVNETGFTGFQVDQCKHSFGYNSVDLHPIVIKFGKVNLLVKSFHVQIWLLRQLVTIATKEGVHYYVVLGSIEAKLGRFYLHSNKKLYKFGCRNWLPWKHGNHGNSK